MNKTLFILLILFSLQIFENNLEGKILIQIERTKLDVLGEPEEPQLYEFDETKGSFGIQRLQDSYTRNTIGLYVMSAPTSGDSWQIEFRAPRYNKLNPTTYQLGLSKGAGMLLAIQGKDIIVRKGWFRVNAFNWNALGEMTILSLDFSIVTRDEELRGSINYQANDWEDPNYYPW